MKSIVHRALVTYSNERTGDIRVKIPAILGAESEVPISFIGRHKTNSIWVVPAVGEQITVSADDENLTNVFWLHTDEMKHTTHYRNYFEAYDTLSHTATLSGGVGVAAAVTYNTVIFAEGIRLVNNSKITFDYEGTYNLQYSIQWQNTDSQAHESVVWIGYNGSPFPESSTYVSIPSKHGSINGTAVTAINFIGKAFAGDYVELYWAASATNISMKTIDSGTITGLPTTAPSAPSVIVTVTQIA